jgi:hypothetical protein
VVTSAISESEHGLSRLVVRYAHRIAPAALAAALARADAWLGPEVAGAPPGQRRLHADLRLRVSDNPSLVTFRKAAYVDIGAVADLYNGWQAEVEWRASTMAPLFPVFSGMITARVDELTLSGWYAPPGGSLGRLADRAILHVAATGTARWLLRELVRAASEQPSR